MSQMLFRQLAELSRARQARIMSQLIKERKKRELLNYKISQYQQLQSESYIAIKTAYQSLTEIPCSSLDDIHHLRLYESARMRKCLHYEAEAEQAKNALKDCENAITTLRCTYHQQSMKERKMEYGERLCHR